MLEIGNVAKNCNWVEDLGYCRKSICIMGSHEPSFKTLGHGRLVCPLSCCCIKSIFTNTELFNFSPLFFLDDFLLKTVTFDTLIFFSLHFQYLPPTAIETGERLTKLREEMINNSISAYIVPPGDSHQVRNAFQQQGFGLDAFKIQNKQNDICFAKIQA